MRLKLLLEIIGTYGAHMPSASSIIHPFILYTFFVDVPNSLCNLLVVTNAYSTAWHDPLSLQLVFPALGLQRLDTDAHVNRERT